MKFFYKIFLSMLFVLTVSLATVEYLTVSYSLERALQREENTAFSQHQMVAVMPYITIPAKVTHPKRVWRMERFCMRLYQRQETDICRSEAVFL